ncbi:MAG: hypothetical protein AAGA58_07460 [Verrucomicrobiota bacterium]
MLITLFMAAVCGGDEREKDRPVELVLDVELIEETKAPSAKEVRPYRRALATSRYRVVKVKKGQFEGKEITVARWVVWEGKEVRRPKVDKTSPRELSLLKLSDSREFRNDYLVDEIGDKNAVIYLEAARPNDPKKTDEGDSEKKS